MNERIREIAEQSGFPAKRAFSDLSDLYPRLDKFAELIVRECAEYVRHWNYNAINNDMPYGVTSDDILNYFEIGEQNENR